MRMTSFTVDITVDCLAAYTIYSCTGSKRRVYSYIFVYDSFAGLNAVFDDSKLQCGYVPTHNDLWMDSPSVTESNDQVYELPFS